MDSVPGIENVAALLEEIEISSTWATVGLEHGLFQRFSDGFSWFILLDDSGRMVCNILQHISWFILLDGLFYWMILVG